MSDWIFISHDLVLGQMETFWSLRGVIRAILFSSLEPKTALGIPHDKTSLIVPNGDKSQPHKFMVDRMIF